MDELTLYARGLTEPEIAAIAAAGTGGKADSSVAPAQSLAKLQRRRWTACSWTPFTGTTRSGPRTRSSSPPYKPTPC